MSFLFFFLFKLSFCLMNEAREDKSAIKTLKRNRARIVSFRWAKGVRVRYEGRELIVAEKKIVCTPVCSKLTLHRLAKVVFK